MNILLDTHIALWALTDSPRLPEKARKLILDPANTLYFSSATVWEISIKHRLARSAMPISGEQVRQLLVDAGYIELPILSVHAAETEKLPLHHNDPFDRILVAQACYEPMRLLTHDRKLAAYGDCIVFV